MAVSDFQNFFEVATGHRRNAVIRACGHVLSSLFSLLPAFFHPALGRGEGKAMATAYARGILATQSRSTLKMQRFEPLSILIIVIIVIIVIIIITLIIVTTRTGAQQTLLCQSVVVVQNSNFRRA